jgi:hypothetical protein
MLLYVIGVGLPFIVNLSTMLWVMNGIEGLKAIGYEIASFIMFIPLVGLMVKGFKLLNLGQKATKVNADGVDNKKEYGEGREDKDKRTKKRERKLLEVRPGSKHGT